MKRFINTLILITLLMCGYQAQAVYVQNMPVVQFQPNGDTLHFFATGDECYHRYHDADNYTIVQNQAGYWVYAMPAPDGGLMPSQYPVGTVNPATLGYQPGLTITRQQWLERRKAWQIPEQYRIATPKTDDRNHGDFCNLVIFIRFADDTAYTRPLSAIDAMFSDSSSVSSNSVYNYFKRVSYNQIFIRTLYAPEPVGDQIRSFQSPHPRNYFMPYNESNPIGYRNYHERTEREFELLVGAVNFINDSCPVPTSFNLDCNNDGFIDNVNFVVKGSTAGWSDLLWPHKWNLYSYDVRINGKQVSTFNFALEGSGADYFGPSTFCHEMFHSLGAPDLYRYNQSDPVAPVGPWDLMATNSKPPQHMSAYMKYRYGNWLDTIPMITTPGTYTLHSVGDSLPGNNIYCFPSSHPDQFYVVEYRDNTEIFETQLPGRGLLIYRIDTRFDGNSGYDGVEDFDGIWLFRPNSNSSEESGHISEAFFSPQRHRTEFSPATDYYPWLSGDNPDYSFAIYNVTQPGTTIKFSYTNLTRPARLRDTRVTNSTASLAWNGYASAYSVYYRPSGSDQPFQCRHADHKFITITNLEPNTIYEWYVRALYNPIDHHTYADSSLASNTSLFHTDLCNNPVTIITSDSYNNPRNGLPYAANKGYNYSQQLFTPDELTGPQTISSISLHYAHSYAFDKTNCTIYMAHTDFDRFYDSVGPVPFSQMTQVFVGDINYSEGWNDIVLNTPFYYNGTDNLVVTILDNSGTPTRLPHTFYTQTTDTPLSLCYSSNTDPIDPTLDSINGTRELMRYRDNIRFISCIENSDQFYACIISENESMGYVSGEGLYNVNETIQVSAHPYSNYEFLRWNDGNTDNPRQFQITQDTTFVAYFKSLLGIDDAPQSGGFVILSRHLDITVQGAYNQPIAIFDIMGRQVANVGKSHPESVQFRMPQTGVYVVRVGDSNPVKLLVQ